MITEIRLIDANALKEAMDKKALDLANGGMIFIESIKHIIDNAQTINKCDNCDLMFKEKTKSIPYDVSEVTDYTAYPTVSEVKND